MSHIFPMIFPADFPSRKPHLSGNETMKFVFPEPGPLEGVKSRSKGAAPTMEILPHLYGLSTQTSNNCYFFSFLDMGLSENS